MFKFRAEIHPETVSEAESRRIMRKYRSERPRKRSVKTPRTTVSLPRLRCLGEWKAEQSQLFED
jgi:hypothetical protein